MWGVLIIPLMNAQSYGMTRSTFSSSLGAEQSADSQLHMLSHTGMQGEMKGQTQGGAEEEWTKGQEDS